MTRDVPETQNDVLPKPDNGPRDPTAASPHRGNNTENLKRESGWVPGPVNVDLHLRNVRHRLNKIRVRRCTGGRRVMVT